MSSDLHAVVCADLRSITISRSDPAHLVRRCQAVADEVFRILASAKMDMPKMVLFKKKKQKKISEPAFKIVATRQTNNDLKLYVFSKITKEHLRRVNRRDNIVDTFLMCNHGLPIHPTWCSVFIQSLCRRGFTYELQGLKRQEREFLLSKYSS